MSPFAHTLTLLALLTVVSAATALSATSRSPSSGYSYNPNAKNGPRNWYKLSHGFRKCHTGRTQSPINIVTSSAKRGRHSYRNRPKSSFLRSVMSWKEGYFNWALSCQEGARCGMTKFQGDKYYLKSVDFHAPSEHTINGKHAPLEMQMVHQSRSGKLAVMATLFHIGKENKVFEKVIDAAERHQKKVGVNLPGLLRPANEFYTYKGSLTTPPCTEGVTWMVAKKTIRVSQWQVDRFVESAHIEQFGNNRAVQEMNDRKVYRYGKL